MIEPAKGARFEPSEPFEPEARSFQTRWENHPQADRDATIEDPNMFTRPWTMRFPLFNRVAKDYEIFEYACHEGNRTLELTPLAGEKK